MEINFNINDIWSDNIIRSRSTKRTYDIRVTLNKRGEGERMAIRFGFINKAFTAFKGYEYIEPSDIEKLQDRIYFRGFKDKPENNRNAHKLCCGDSAKSLYITITPTKNGDKIYRMKWVGGTFHIKYDEQNKLYYIEINKED